MITLFVFDLGNVILPFEHRQIAVKLHEVSRIQNRFTSDDLFRFLFDRDWGFVNPYEEGRISSRDFFAKLRERYKLELEFEEFKDIWNNIFEEDPEVNAIITHLKNKGYPVFLLSNTNELHFSYVIERYPIVHSLDEWILSYEVGARKPKKRSLMPSSRRQISYGMKRFILRILRHTWRPQKRMVFRACISKTQKICGNC
jgi:putative hydrolase of the HAD superfamily